MSYMLQPQIVVLKEGTDDSQGKNQIISNINACTAVAEILRTTLGPSGMDKMVQTQREHTISNDGATIMALLELSHPAARLLADISKAQDEEVGDGTTSVVLLAGELLRVAKQFIDEGIAPQLVARAMRQARDQALARLTALAFPVSEDPARRRELLVRCAETALNSKLLAHYKTFFAEMVVDAVARLDGSMLDPELIGIKHVAGGSVRDSFLVDGVAFKKTFAYAGFEQQPKKFTAPRVLLLNVELEIKAERDNAEVRIERADQFQAVVEAEWKIIYDKLEAIVNCGAQVILSKLPIGDLATQYFADRGLFCAGRVEKGDMARVERATGGRVQATVSDLRAEQLGACGEFEEVALGAERFNIFRNCPKSTTATIVLRGGADQFSKESERSLNDALMVVRRLTQSQLVVAGGGAVEMELSKLLRQHAREVNGKEQLIISAYAKALEVIPRTLAENAGLDANEVLGRLRQRHAQGEQGRHFGVDVRGEEGGVCDTMESFVWEPLAVKRNYITSASEAACLILTIDETIKAPQQVEEQKMNKQPRPGPRPGPMRLK